MTSNMRQSTFKTTARSVAGVQLKLFKALLILQAILEDFLEIRRCPCSPNQPRWHTLRATNVLLSRLDAGIQGTPHLLGRRNPERETYANTAWRSRCEYLAFWKDLDLEAPDRIPLSRKKEVMYLRSLIDMHFRISLASQHRYNSHMPRHALLRSKRQLDFGHSRGLELCLLVVWRPAQLWSEAGSQQPKQGPFR